MGLACLLGGVLALGFRPSLYAPYFEGSDYVDIANLNISQASSYYAGRVLHPLTVRLVASVLHVPIDARVFLWVSAASLIVFFSCLGAYYGLEFPSAPGPWPLLVVTAMIVDQYRNYYWHDLFYAALCALFFLALRANWWISLPIVLMLYVTRESTIVLVVALIAIASFRHQWAFCLSAVVVGLAGMSLESALVARALPNKHGIPIALLDALKIPYNFALNVCGLEFWTNTNAATTDPPKWVASVPAWLHMGNIRQVGFSGFFWERPARTFLLISTAFGILPLAAIRAAARGWGRLLLRRFDLAVAFVYGTLMFILAPLQGTIPARYVLYGWPVFWLFGVALLEAAFPDSRKRIKIVLLSLCAAWTPAVVRLVTGPTVQGPESLSNVSRTGLLISLALVFAIYVCGWRLAESAKPATE
jgi:hypothetical protein